MNSLRQRDMVYPEGQKAAILGSLTGQVPVGATAASILFGQPLGAGFLGFTLGQTTGGTLTLLHTYTITSSLITPIAETIGSTASITLTGSNDAITITNSSVVSSLAVYRKKASVLHN